MTETIVSFSEIYKFQTCIRQYYYNRVLGLSPIKTKDAPDTGTKGHKLLQYFYTLMAQGYSKEEAWRYTTKRATEEMLKHDIGDGNLLIAWTLIDNYIRANEFPHTAILIENRFLIPASTLTDDPELAHVQIGFTPDVVFERKGGFLDVEDFKFIQRGWSQKKTNRIPQLKIYQILLEHMNYNISRSVLRFFNTTTAEITAKPYVLRGEERANLTYDFLYGVKELIKFKEGSPDLLARPPRTMNYNACQFCDYEFPCTLEAEGKDASKTLKYQYKKSDYDYRN